MKTFHALLVWKCIFDIFLEFQTWLHTSVLLVFLYFSMDYGLAAFSSVVDRGPASFAMSFTQLIALPLWYTAVRHVALVSMVSRGVMIRVPHDTILILIQRSRYNTYLDTYLNTVRCQRDVMSSMKADNCDQEPRAQPATPVDGVPTTTTADVEPRCDFAELY